MQEFLGPFANDFVRMSKAIPFSGSVGDYLNRLACSKSALYVLFYDSDTKVFSSVAFEGHLGDSLVKMRDHLQMTVPNLEDIESITPKMYNHFREIVSHQTDATIIREVAAGVLLRDDPIARTSPYRLHAGVVLFQRPTIRSSMINEYTASVVVPRC